MTASRPEVETPAVTCAPVSAGVHRIVLQRAPANALGPPIIDGLAAALDAVDAAGGARVVVVESALPGFFAAGADIKFMAGADPAAFAAYGERLRVVFDRLADAAYLSVAAIDGLALGGGLELALACTLRVGGADARVGLPEVRLGLIPGAGGTQRLPRVVGRGRALDIILTGRQVPADEAHRMGLLDRLVAAGTAAAAAAALADELVAASLPAQRAAVRSVDAAFDGTLADGQAYEAGEVQSLFADGEAGEGIRAFVEKRRPQFGAT